MKPPAAEDLWLGRWTLRTGSIAFAALALVVALGVLLQIGANALRLNLGPHGWFVISSIRSAHYRRGQPGVTQTDGVLNGPFASRARCEDALRKSWSRDPSVYCRDILDSDARAIWRGTEPMPTGLVP